MAFLLKNNFALKKSFKISVYSFLAFLFFSLFEVYSWKFNFWFLRISFILFFSSFIAGFIYSGKKASSDITKSFGWASIGYFFISAIFISFGSIFLALVLGLLLWPILGPSQIIKQNNFVIQRPCQGFMGSANNLQFIERKFGIFEKNISYIQTDPIIQKFEYIKNENLLILLPSNDTINLKTCYKWK